MNNAAPPPAKWDDLTVRLTSSAAMVVIGAFGVILGGIWFQMLVVFVTAVMVWELWMMIRPSEPTKGMLMAALVASVMSGQLAEGSTLGDAAVFGGSGDRGHAAQDRNQNILLLRSWGFS